MKTPRIPVPYDQIAAFCHKWKVTELALFGSVLTDEFRPDSDVDVLVTYGPDAIRTFDAFFEMQDELKAIFGREIDLVNKSTLRNPYIKKHVMESYQVVYAA